MYTALPIEIYSNIINVIVISFDIGSRANEFGNIDIPQIKRKLPQSLSEQDLVKEAALVLAQAEQADISRNQYHTSSVPGIVVRMVKYVYKTLYRS